MCWRASPEKGSTDILVSQHSVRSIASEAAILFLQTERFVVFLEGRFFRKRLQHISPSTTFQCLKLSIADAVLWSTTYVLFDTRADPDFQGVKRKKV